ncbi:ABC transporter ATP-binding protein [Heyndrickxia oleronia]|jgi:iron(III) transport system ATP-binding protein|uniref:Spermidine/putrescine import ATP-binding protein PotA n=1 Tax=Heyndrickxia oleronia TaxID=38875 RepID=A0A8E2IDQ5_9BACI|nr:ABC transporter ATP-binding protein [Heyndrickxia oleronia]NYV65239.1 ABC transporter ATP-binding protein [Bacillus sp. Gen3]MBU5213006.1 ABC transporter ATP-binding protein [Heyndrickxia oleronia]MCM3452524.1 ABC transporter ATP-binding protein [Heyndrickxia oleronia]MEC1376983.1 ABC transporter ATP-binding protein [Heyndrickxia oleronia]OOP68026.1 spermidine/putrescine ABC transporter ATP-binding protein [Heyndrickxia oleronia]
MASINLENVQKTFGKVIAVDQLNLQIREGEFFTFLGPSGCGKTTTLRMIAGFYYPTKGIVRFGEKDMTRVPPEKRNTGMVFQNYALFPHMTVFENVAFGLKVRKIPSTEIKNRVHDVLEKVRLDTFSNRQVSQLSGGQQQRVALARALVIEPEILLLDEPLSNLDAKLRDEMRTEILRLQRDYHITTIYVTHDQAEALSMSDRIAVFNNGVCHQIGTPFEIYNEPANDFVAQFIGEINFIPFEMDKIKEEKIEVRIIQGNQSLSVKRIPFNDVEFSMDEKLILSIRPESIKLSTQAMEGENVLEGKIESLQFFGSAVEILVKVQDITLKVNLLNPADLSVLKKESMVWLELPADRIRLIPKISGDRL